MFTVVQVDTNYSEIPTGPIEDMTFDEFVAKWDLEVVDETTVRAEWGNGAGYDTFRIDRPSISTGHAEPFYALLLLALAILPALVIAL